MLGLIIFDRLNDVVFAHGDDGFEQHIRNMAAKNGLFYPAWSEQLPETWSERADVLVQLFSPFLASQRIMELQYRNPYSSIECDNGLRMTFAEYMTYQCLCLGQDCDLDSEQYLSVAVSIAKLLCGPVLSRLKSDDCWLASQLAAMLTSYRRLQHRNQAFCVEAVERLIIGDHVQNKMVSVLQRVVSSMPSGGRSHAFLAVDCTLVSLYSGRQVADLSPAALLHLLLMVDSLKPSRTYSDMQGECGSGGSADHSAAGAAASPAPAPSEDAAEPAAARRPDGADIREMLCFLRAARSPLSPHLVYVLPVWQDLQLVIVIDVCMTDVSGGLCEAIESVAKSHQAVTSTQRCQIHGHLKHGLAVIFSYARQLGKSSQVRSLVGRLRSQWDQLRSLRIEDALKTSDDVPPAIEQGLASLSRTLESAFEAICHALPERASVACDQLTAILTQAQLDLDDYRSFLRARAVSNATVNTRIHLNISRYLDNFPDLLHFIYVDRSAHLMTAPSALASELRHDLTRTIWTMVALANRYLYEGHMSTIWRDGQYSYAHFLWFEDAMGGPLKARENPRRLKALFPDLRPGILVRDYFSKLMSVCFPDASADAVKCFQLFLVHRGPVQSARVLEQSQQIARTVAEVSGGLATSWDLM